MVAYHEAGHTIVGLVLSDARIVHKVCGEFLGYITDQA